MERAVLGERARFDRVAAADATIAPASLVDLLHTTLGATPAEAEVAEMLSATRARAAAADDAVTFERFVAILAQVQRREVAFADYERMMADFGALALEFHSALDENDGETSCEAAAPASDGTSGA